MTIIFEKYQGAGNDFIIVDNRDGSLSSLSEALISKMCNRHMGIGADGLIAFSVDSHGIPKMDYYNADGKEGSLCGNGARCFSLFVRNLNLFNQQGEFKASDGMHLAKFLSDGNISIAFHEPRIIEAEDDHYIVDTGSPHYVKWVDHLSVDVYGEGKKIRNSERFRKEGINVNFVMITEGEIQLRTYERGVENETLACGTGVVASAIAAFHSKKIKTNTIKVNALGGTLYVSFNHSNSNFNNLWLSGPARKVYTGCYFTENKD